MAFGQSKMKIASIQQASGVGDAISSLSPVLYLEPPGSSDTQWNDSSGNGLNGTIVGTITPTANSLTYEWVFNGTSYFDFSDDPLLDFTPSTDEFTIIWREGDTRPTTGYAISKQGSSLRQYGFYYTGSSLGVYIGNTGSTSGVISGNTNNNRLFIAVVTTTTLNVWMDGVQVYTDQAIGTTVATGQSLNVGSRTDGSFLIGNGEALDLVAVIPSAINGTQRAAIETEFQVN